ncbi:MAG: enoyl-CoA hydratase/isomerase family protein [Chloroflexi bacterium]|nr:enoyl-CoA hydratase/isomerase family protein [Chloroflexota bacterium]
MFDTLLYEKQDGIAWITLNRPDVLNAINMRMRDELWDAAHAVRDDPDVRVVIFKGAGERAFSAGADISEFGTAPSYVESRRARRQRDLWGFILSLELPLIAAVHGHTLGAGIELSMCCDLRIASEDARLGLPEVSLGYIPSAGGTQTLPRHIPPGVAMQMILTGDPIDAATALRYGLIQRVVPRERLYKEAESLAHTLMSRGPLALRLAKRAVLEGLDLPLAQGLALERRLARRALASADAREGLAATAAGREPRFVGA